jgi:hypothetical protein
MNEKLNSVFRTEQGKFQTLQGNYAFFMCIFSFRDQQVKFV